MKRILFTLLFTSSLFAQDVTGVFPPGERYEAPADHAPANVSRMFIRAVTASSVDLPATGGGGMIIWTIPASKNARVTARLTTPSGDVLRPQESGSIDRGLRRFQFDAAEVGIDLPPAKQEVLHVMKTEAASYRIDVDVPALVVAAEPDSPVAMETWVTPLSRQPGEPVTMFARFSGGVGSASVTARIGKETIALTEKDGVYSATLNPDVAGVQPVRFDATGETREGVRFARSGSSEFVAERGAARLGAIHAERIDGALRVTASADVAVPGAYRFDVIVVSNGTSLAWGEGVRQLTEGPNELVLDIPLPSPAADLQLDVRLLGLDTIGVAGRRMVEVQ